MNEVSLFLKTKGLKAQQSVGLNVGGTVDFSGWEATLVWAAHSCSCNDINPEHIMPGGAACGWVIKCPDGAIIYHAGDTAVTTDMKIVSDLYAPSLAILPIGGHYCMGPQGAAYCIDNLLPNINKVIPWSSCFAMTDFPVRKGTVEEVKYYVRRKSVDIINLKAGKISIMSLISAKKRTFPVWIVIAIGTVFIFSADQITRKLAVGAIPPLWMATFAFSLASVSLWVFALLTKTYVWPRSTLLFKKHLVSGFLYALVSFLSLYGLKLTLAGRTGILFFSYPFFVCIFGSLGPKAEKISSGQRQGMGIACLGIIFIVLNKSGDTSNLLGDCLILLSAVIMGYLIVHLRDLSRETTTKESVLWQLTLCVPFCLGGALAFEDISNIHLSFASFNAILYQGLIINCVGVLLRGEISQKIQCRHGYIFFLFDTFFNHAFELFHTQRSSPLDSRARSSRSKLGHYMDS